MRIGIDFRAMQIGHQFRGIGEVLRNACREIDRRAPAGDEIVAFVNPAAPPVDDVVARSFGPERATSVVGLPGPGSRRSRLRDPLSADQAAVFAAGCDVLVQVDFQLGVPRQVPTLLVVHDQIPLQLGAWYPHMYLPTYQLARRRGMGRRSAGERAMRRWLYELKLRVALARAARVIVYSDHSRSTTLAFAAEHGVTGLEERMHVVHLGHQGVGTDVAPLTVMDEERFKAFDLTERPFLLYMGGADERRRIDLLVGAFNELRADGIDLKLVLTGDTLGSYETVGSEASRRALMGSSYSHDIHLLGYVNASERNWLYRHAEAFVFPSEYEGFGLPVIEALATGCSVVAFDTTSIPEVSGPNCTLVKPGRRTLAAGIAEVLRRSPEQRAADREAGQAFAGGFTWDALGLELIDWLETNRPT